jgi:hypothetical protein
MKAVILNYADGIVSIVDIPQEIAATTEERGDAYKVEEYLDAQGYPQSEISYMLCEGKVQLQVNGSNVSVL